MTRKLTLIACIAAALSLVASAADAQVKTMKDREADKKKADAEKETAKDEEADEEEADEEEADEEKSEGEGEGEGEEDPAADGVKTMQEREEEAAAADDLQTMEERDEKVEADAAGDTTTVEAEAEAGGMDSHDLMFTLAPHIGVTSPQLFSDLGSWPIFGLEFGYILPFDASDSMQRPMAITFDVMYTAPSADGSGSDPNLGLEGADYNWELNQQMLILELGAIWRFMPPGAPLSAFANLGWRAYLMEAIMTAEGNGGADFGENRETHTEYGGLVVGGGVEWLLGPGALFGALELGYSNLDQRITGEANTGALVLDIGYRLLF